MTRWYSPKLKRELVSKLYFRAKAERIPMTKLANRLIAQALGQNESTETPKPDKNQNDHDSQ